MVEARSQYQQIADELAADIEGGTLAPDSVVPPEPELAARFHTTRATINNAMRILRQRGLVRVHRGRETRVRPTRTIIRDASRRYSRDFREQNGGRGAFDSEIRALGYEPRSDQTVELVEPPPGVAAQLGLPAGERNTIRRGRHMFASDHPVQVAPSYIPAEIAVGTQLAEADSGPGGIISRFEELGYKQVRITERISYRPATPGERRLLELDELEPVAEIWHVGWTKDDRAVEVCVHVVPAGSWEFSSEWLID